MGLWSRLFGRETKAVEFSPEILSALENGWGVPSKSGQAVSTNTALNVTPFYRGVLVIAEGIAQLPVEPYRQIGRGAQPARDHELYDLIAHQPNALQDSFQFYRTFIMHAAASGNAVAYKNMVNGRLREIIPVRPDLVTIELNRFQEREYTLHFETGDYVKVGQSEVLHLSGPAWKWHEGIEPATVGREAIGLAQATEESHSRLHKNGSRPSGTLESDKSLTQPQVDALREMWQSTYGGGTNSGKTAVLANGLKWKQIAFSGVDSEHLDTRKMQIEEIARLLGVFPIMLGHAGDQSPTFASADAFLEAHVRYTLQPWIKALVKALETQLFTRAERESGLHIRIDTSELLRGSLKDRTEYYKAALGTNSSPGWMKPNEVREDDGWDPDPDPNMDKVWQPATMAPVDAPKETAPNQSSNPQGEN